jgi:hypothetical protein
LAWPIFNWRVLNLYFRHSTSWFDSNTNQFFTQLGRQRPLHVQGDAGHPG